MNTPLLLVTSALLFTSLINVSATLLNIKSFPITLPEELHDTYSKEAFLKSRAYTLASGRLSIFRNIWSTLLILFFLLFGGFNSLDLFLRAFDLNLIITGLLYLATLALLLWLADLPFLLYNTFVIEEQFGFNRMTLSTWLLDTIKKTLLSAILGGLLLAFLLWFFSTTGSSAWLWCWIVFLLFSVVIQYLAPVLIMPLFNTFVPLKESDVQRQIQNYIDKENFPLQGIFTMDGSRRSTRLNAFFTGFGRFRKIVFFDTILEKLNAQQIVAVLAHEMGHYKLHHIGRNFIFFAIQTGLTLYLLSLLLNSPETGHALNMDTSSLYAGLPLFVLIYGPAGLLFGVIFNALSRRHEFAADAFAARSTGRPQDLVSSLKILSTENLNNPAPHPLYVLLHYSHPPLAQRLKYLQSPLFNQSTDSMYYR